MKVCKRGLSAVALAVGMALSGIAHAELVTNGGFESGDFSGWNQSSTGSLVDADPTYVHSGDYAAFLGEYGSIGSIGQQLATAAGQRYTLRFWLGNMGASLLNDDALSFFSFAIGGVVQPASPLYDKTERDLTLYTLSFTAADPATDLTFSFRQDDTFWFLDDVSVVAANDSVEVAEPATLPLLLAALAGWMGLSRVRANTGRGRK